jgi:hypothetical protein
MSRYRHDDADRTPTRRRSTAEPLQSLIERADRRALLVRVLPGAAALATLGARSLGASLRAGARGANGANSANSANSAIRAAAAGSAATAAASAASAQSGSLLGFKPVPPSSDDTLVVPDAYTAHVLLAWGDPVGVATPDGRMPDFAPDGSNTAADQALQAGMHHDGMHFFPIDLPGAPMLGASATLSSRHGLLAINHEYFDGGLLVPRNANWPASERVRKSQAAVGVSIVEVQLLGGRWQVLRPSRYGRRIHANTPVRFSGPAAGHPSMRTREFPDGRTGLGTTGNCARGWTPWGTYLSCEEGCYVFFKPRAKPEQDEHRMGYGRGERFGWSAADPRFGAERDPNNVNHFDWVVEIDPFDAKSVPVKRTALGRIQHECATPAVCKDGRVAFYLTDDDRDEYLYKFVTARPWSPRDRAANRDLLDEGTLYVAKFDADGSGRWLELAPGRNGLTPEKGFATQSDVCLRTRWAGDAAGATPLDRPEWVAVDPTTPGRLLVSLTNNTSRKSDPKDPGEKAVNVRSPNRDGHLVRWTEQGGDHAATRFRWEVFVVAGDPQNPDAVARGTQRGDAFSSPDGLLVDARGVVWVQTDGGDSKVFGNNSMLAVDPNTKEARRFLTGPRGCEISGATLTPDGRTMFVNVMHPGEGAKSNWPDGGPDARPRSATVVVRRNDGGVIGT